MIEVFLALGSALLYGAADFCGGLASKRTSMIAVTVVSQTAGFVVLLAAIVFLPGRAALNDYLYGGVAGVFGGPSFRHTYPNGDRVEYVVVVYECAVVGGTLGGLDD